jgi:acetyltransferase-like isoleucine patch superfamily enzyme
MIKRLLNSMRHERPQYALLAICRLIVEQITGRVHGRLLGWAGSYLGPGSRVIGSRYISVAGHAHINRYAWIEAVHTFRGQEFRPAIKIGRGFAASDRLHISCTHRVEIGNDCLLGSGVYISDHNHGIYNGLGHSAPTEPPTDRKLLSTGSVTIGANVWVGDNVVIVGPVTIGDGAVIGANSVITKNIPSNVIAAGSPAQVLKKFNCNSGAWEKFAEKAG